MKPNLADRTCKLLKWVCNYRKLHNKTTREQLWQYSLLLLTKPELRCGQMKLEGVKTEYTKYKKLGVVCHLIRIKKVNYTSRSTFIEMCEASDSTDLKNAGNLRENLGNSTIPQEFQLSWMLLLSSAEWQLVGRHLDGPSMLPPGNCRQQKNIDHFKSSKCTAPMGRDCKHQHIATYCYIKTNRLTHITWMMN